MQISDALRDRAVRDRFSWEHESISSSSRSLSTMQRSRRFVTRLLCVLMIPALTSLGSGPGQRAFTDVTSSSGLAGFINKQGTKRKDYIVESIGGGAAFFDFDADGWLDI